jgi:restriction endonuclease S subunit
LIQSDLKEFELVLKIEKDKQPLSHFAEVFSGIKVYAVGAGNPPQTVEIRDTKPFTSNQPITEEWKPFYDGKHVGRYQQLWNSNNWIYYGKWLAAPSKPVNFTGEKLLIRKIVGDTLIATYIPETSYCNTLLHVLKIRPDANSVSYQYLLGILNSQLIGWYFRKKFQISAEDTFPQIMIRDILQFPIPLPDQAIHVRLVHLVTYVLDLHKRLATALDPHGKTVLKRQIEAIDEEIDRVVYGLYNLTAEEIEIVGETFI